MPAGTLHVTGPSQPLTADFGAPCEFIHFHVSNDYVRKCQRAAQSSSSEVLPDLNDLIVRDPLAELLGRTLTSGGNVDSALYAKSVVKLVMHIARTRLQQRNVSPLQKWRLHRVQKYVDEHLDGARVFVIWRRSAGLSRMHFAAQFRAATGCRPHEYVLCRRIENAKALLSNTDAPIVEVALRVGFQLRRISQRYSSVSPANRQRVGGVRWSVSDLARPLMLAGVQIFRGWNSTGRRSGRIKCLRRGPRIRKQPT